MTEPLAEHLNPQVLPAQPAQQEPTLMFDHTRYQQLRNDIQAAREEQAIAAVIRVPATLPSWVSLGVTTAGHNSY